MDANEAFQSWKEGVTPNGGHRETAYEHRHALVTGALGGIGQHLVRQLLAVGYGRVRAVDVKPAPQEWRGRRGLECLQADLEDLQQARSVQEGCTDVFHLASDEGGRAWREDHRFEGHGNEVLHQNVLMSAAESLSCVRLTLASSAGVSEMESSAAAISEGARSRIDQEAHSKHFAERLGRELQERGRFELRVARIHSVFADPGHAEVDRMRVGPALLWRVLRIGAGSSRPLELRSAGDVERSFLSAADCAEGLHRIHESGGLDPIELGGPKMTLDSLLDRFEALVGTQAVRRRRTDLLLGPHSRTCDLSRLHRQLGWTPAVLSDQVLGEVADVLHARLASR